MAKFNFKCKKKKKFQFQLINARITKKTFKRWMLFFLKLQKKFLVHLIYVLTSNKETKKYLKKLNAKNIFYTGNIKLINTLILI